MILFTVFVFGLVIGSFLNAFIYRMEVRDGLGLGRNPVSPKPSVWRGRSFCPLCGHTLSWRDLIPLASFIFLRGKCRYCKGKISWQYPLLELVIGFTFLAIFNFQFLISNEFSISQFLNLFYLWAVASALIAIFVYDLKHFLIPNMLVYFGIGLVFLWRIAEFLSFQDWDLIGNFEPLIFALLSVVGASLFFFIIYVVSRGRAMGFGDVKLVFLLGLFLGWPSILVALFAAFCLGALVGLVLIAFKKKGLKSEVPFAPFLILGTAIAFFFGKSILHWYLNLFLV